MPPKNDIRTVAHDHPCHTPSPGAIPPRKRLTWLCAALPLVFLQACSTVPSGPVSAIVQNQPIQTSTADFQSTTRSSQSSALGSDIALYAMGLLDQRYRYGGKSIVAGLDCSGLVSLVYREAAGMEVRGSSAEMALKARPIPAPTLQAGDLVFFNTLGQPRSHVGVYVGNGRFVHAANERKGVRMDRMDDRYYAARFEGAATLLD